MSRAVTIRLATPADAPGCLAIYRPFVEQTPVTFERAVPGEEEFAGRMRDVLALAPWLVAEEGGAVAGYVYATKYRARPAYQWSLETTVYLAEAARGRGLGRLLYANLLDALRRQGFVNALAAITLPNPASVTLHERLGFQAVGVKANVGHKLGQWHPVGWWQLELQPPPPSPHDPVPLPEIADRLTWRQPE